MRENSLLERIKVQIKEITIENGRAALELTLPEVSKWANIDCLEIFLWEKKDFTCPNSEKVGQTDTQLPLYRYSQPVFHSLYVIDEYDNPVINLTRPHLWEGTQRPVLYQLEIYARDGARRELVYSRAVALRSLKEIPEKGLLLNGKELLPKGIYYDSIYDICVGKDERSKERILSQLQILARMGANMIVLGSAAEITEEEWLLLQEMCDCAGLLLGIREKESKFANIEDIMTGNRLFEENGLPTVEFYQCAARWGREPFVYINDKSFRKHSDGSYEITVYTNCKKVVLMVNNQVFGVQEGGAQMLFQDISIKSFPVDITAQAEECSMTLRCYQAR